MQDPPEIRLPSHDGVRSLRASWPCSRTNWQESKLLSADTDKIEALSPDRAALWDRVSKAPFLSVNEKRLATGYGPAEGGDVFPSPQ